MNEKDLHKNNETPITPAQLVQKLSAFAMRHDPAFRRGECDITSLTKERRQRAATLHNNVTDQEIHLYNEERLYFSAERSDYDHESDSVTPPTRFVTKLETVTQINQLPQTLLRYFDEEAIDTYDTGEPGDLNILRSIEYTVEIDDIDIDITRNREYYLRDCTDIIHYAGELDETDTYEIVPVPSEQHTLRVPKKIQEERIEDEAAHILEFIQFDERITWNGNQEFYNQFLQARNAEAIIAIDGLLKSLHTGEPAPRLLADDYDSTKDA